MEYFRPDVKVGGFLLATLALLIVAALSVGNLDSWFAPKKALTILFRNANLLTEGVRVTYAGYPVGQVTEIQVRPAEERLQRHMEYPVAVSIMVRENVPVRQDSRIEMKTDGVIGDRYIDIHPGIADPVPAGSMVLGTMGGVDGVLASFGGAEGGIQDLVGALHVLLTDASSPDSIPGTLLSMQRLFDTLPGLLAPIAPSVDALGERVGQEITQVSGTAQHLLKDVNATLAENRTGLRRLIGELNATMDDMRRTMAAAQALMQTDTGAVPAMLRDLRRLIEDIQKNREMMVARVEKLVTDMDAVVVRNDRNLFTTIENLRDMSVHLEAAAELVRTNPAILVWGKRAQDQTQVAPAVDAARQLLKDRGRVGRYDRVR
ncbi:MAG: MlaD family protein [Candidatus Tectomicrobia bacterium]|nr:MlaD family protein [Candidatus Tectomicrobia bacterium]